MNNHGGRLKKHWLQDYVNQKYDAVPQYIDVKKKEKGRLTIQCDEMWSFVGNKENKQWIWLALDYDSGEVAGVFVGSRDMEGAKGVSSLYFMVTILLRILDSWSSKK
ncbi:MAG: hypothetical protein HQL61_07090 [Magnetococcales bacterium]|nr:hypothetical protein [Nitrospirota bacterium]